MTEKENAQIIEQTTNHLSSESTHKECVMVIFAFIDVMGRILGKLSDKENKYLVANSLKKNFHEFDIHKKTIEEIFAAINVKKRIGEK